MNATALIGRNEKVRANNFIEIDLSARISYVDEYASTFLLELEIPITISGVTYTHAIGAPRLARDNLNVLLSRGVVGCGVTWIPKERFNGNKPIDLSWWRGGAAAVADVSLI